MNVSCLVSSYCTATNNILGGVSGTCANGTGTCQCPAGFFGRDVFFRDWNSCKTIISFYDATLIIGLVFSVLTTLLSLSSLIKLLIHWNVLAVVREESNKEINNGNFDSKKKDRPNSPTAAVREENDGADKRSSLLGTVKIVLLGKPATTNGEFKPILRKSTNDLRKFGDHVEGRDASPRSSSNNNNHEVNMKKGNSSSPKISYNPEALEDIKVEEQQHGNLNSSEIMEPNIHPDSGVGSSDNSQVSRKVSIEKSENHSSSQKKSGGGNSNNAKSDFKKKVSFIATNNNKGGGAPHSMVENQVPETENNDPKDSNNNNNTAGNNNAATATNPRMKLLVHSSSSAELLKKSMLIRGNIRPRFTMNFEPFQAPKHNVNSTELRHRISATKKRKLIYFLMSHFVCCGLYSTIIFSYFLYGVSVQNLSGALLFCIASNFVHFIASILAITQIWLNGINFLKKYGALFPGFANHPMLSKFNLIYYLIVGNVVVYVILMYLMFFILPFVYGFPAAFEWAFPAGFTILAVEIVIMEVFFTQICNLLYALVRTFETLPRFANTAANPKEHVKTTKTVMDYLLFRKGTETVIVLDEAKARMEKMKKIKRGIRILLALSFVYSVFVFSVCISLAWSAQVKMNYYFFFTMLLISQLSVVMSCVYFFIIRMELAEYGRTSTHIRKPSKAEENVKDHSSNLF